MKPSTTFQFATALVLTTLVVACGSSPTSPTAPSLQPQAGGGGGPVTALATDPGLPQGTADLKATAPTPTAPADGAEFNEPNIVLTVANPQSIYDVAWPFDVTFELFRTANPGTAVHTRTVAQGPGSTSLTVPPGVLQDETQYVWRARAESEGQAGPWSEVYAFSTLFVNVGPPTPVAPANGAVVGSLRPRLTLDNGTEIGDPGLVSIEAQISTNQAFTPGSIVQTLTAHTRAGGQTNLHPRQDLQTDTLYFWRGRSTNRPLPDTNGVLPTPVQTVIQVTSDWSPVRSFRTPDAAALEPDPPSPPSSGGGGPDVGPAPPGGCCPPPNRFVVVQAVAAQTGYPNSGIDVREFTQRVAERLHAEDSNWGRYENTKGELSKDGLAYRRSSGRPFKVDIVQGAGSSSPRIHWAEEGIAHGKWRAP